jgi:hypothetical protein
MSQPPASQSVATAGISRLRYYQLRDWLLSLRDSLEDAKRGKDTALEWVREYCVRMVRLSPFLFLSFALISS